MEGRQGHGQGGSRIGRSGSGGHEPGGDKEVFICGAARTRVSAPDFASGITQVENKMSDCSLFS
jgi:hypothetical protein